jgi:16S rRNA G527 N7-methylase RsmG
VISRVQSFNPVQWSELSAFLSKCAPDKNLSTDDFRRSLERFLSLLLERNELVNLTSIRSWDDAVWKHLADSLSLLHLNNLGAVLDWGTGGGLPGIPLLLARRSLGDSAPVYFVDSVGKKILSVRYFLDQLGFSGDDLAYIGRGEQVLSSLKVDTVVMRAVAPPEKACLWMRGNAKRWIVFCGPTNRDVWLKSKALLLKNGLILENEHFFELPHAIGSRYLLQFAKK